MVASTIVDLAEARATRRKNTDSHAPSEPRFVVQHGSKPGTRRVVSAKTGRPANDVVYTDADGKAPFELRDKLNAEAEIDERLAHTLSPDDHVIAYFESADTQEKLHALLTAYENGAMFTFMEFAVEIGRGVTEATAGR
jgi:hypothetical protein